MSGTTFSLPPGAVDSRPANAQHAGLMPRWHVGDATHAPFGAVQVGSHSDVYVALATSTVAGAMPASANVTIGNLTLTALNGVSVAGFTDANGWTGALLLSGKRVWCKRVTVNSGWPAATAWANMFTSNLPTGMADLTAVRFSFGFFASTWARVMTLAPDATTASTTIVMNGTLAAGPGNWSAINPVVVFDLQCVEI